MSDIDDINAVIARVETEINQVNEQIRSVESSIEVAKDKILANENKEFWESELQQLREEKMSLRESLRRKEEHMYRMEEQLREEKKLLHESLRRKEEHEYRMEELREEKKLRATMSGRPNPRYPNSVFFICDRGNCQPVATCFAISSKYLLSCQHFMDRGNCLYSITLSISKRNGQLVFEDDIRPVKVIRYNTQMDYALLELQDGLDNLEAIPISLDPVEPDIDIKIFHGPVAMFNDSLNGELTVFSDWVKTGRPKAHHIRCKGSGLFRGSSGGPYVLRDGRVVGIHLESESESKEIDVDELKRASGDDAMEIISSTVNSNASSYASICSSLYISKCTKLVNFLREIEILPKC